MHTLDNLANTSLDAGLISQIGDVLATLANDNTSFFGGNDGSQGQLCLSILIVRLGRGLSVGTQTRLVIVDLELVEGVAEVRPIGGDLILGGRHVGFR